MRLIIIFIVSLMTSLANAADWSGTVTLIRGSNTSNAILFKLSNELKSPARCNEFGMYAIDLGKPGGKAVFELIRTAYVNKAYVEANSLGTCAIYWKAEGVKDIYLK